MLRWWVGANRAALRGGALAVKAFFGTAGASEISRQAGIYSLDALSWQQLAAVFGTAFVYEFVRYLGETPIPELPAPAGPPPALPAPGLPAGTESGATV